MTLFHHNDFEAFKMHASREGRRARLQAERLRDLLVVHENRYKCNLNAQEILDIATEVRRNGGVDGIKQSLHRAQGAATAWEEIEYHILDTEEVTASQSAI